MNIKKKTKWEFSHNDMFPTLQRPEETLFSLTIRNYHNDSDEDKQYEISKKKLLELSTLSGLVRATFQKKVDKKYLEEYINSNMHLDLKKVLESIQVQEIEDSDSEEEEQFIDIMDDVAGKVPQPNVRSPINTRNIIIYTPQYDFDYND